jgi:hypothetical protein
MHVYIKYLEDGIYKEMVLQAQGKYSIRKLEYSKRHVHYLSVFDYYVGCY